MGKKNKRKQVCGSELQVAHIDPAPINRFLGFIDGVTAKARHCTSIVTFNSFNRDWTQKYDVHTNPETGESEWGYELAHKALLSAKLVNPETYPLSVVCRTFNSKWHLAVTENGKKMLIPGKDIRMWFIPEYGQFIQMSEADCFAAMNTDARTGEPLPLDSTLEFVCDVERSN